MGVPQVSIERRLADLGWNGVPLPTAITNILWLFVSSGMDTSALLRQLDTGGRLEPGVAGCRRMLRYMLDEAARAGRLDLLRCPCLREPEQVLALLEQVFGGGCAE